MKDAFSIGASNRNTNCWFVVARFMEHDHIIEALASNGSNHSLYIGSLPSRAWCGKYFGAAARVKSRFVAYSSKRKG